MPEMQDTQKANQRGCLIASALVLLFVGFLELKCIFADKHPADSEKPGAADQRSANSEKPGSDEETAKAVGYTMAKRIVGPALKAPATADFPWNTVSVAGSGVDRWRVTGAVDAQNSFGAQLRSYWEVAVAHQNGQWFPAEAKLDGKTVF